MIQPVKSILVDDQPGKLLALKSQLEDTEALPFSVEPFSNPYEVITYLRENAGSVEFAFIDNVIVADRPRDCPSEVPTLNDGIDLAREISKQWPHIGIILYSGDENITEADEWRGLAAGARRYVRIAPPQSLVDVATKEFVGEIRELRGLQHTLRQYYQSWTTTDILHRSVPVGIDLIDRRFKVWYTNKQFEEILGFAPNPQQFCCAQFHNRDWPPCPGCLVAEGLSLTKEEWQERRGRIDRIFYSPVYCGCRYIFKYLHVWAEPVYLPAGSDRPIAVVESVIDLTESPTVEQMGLEENLDILLRAIAELTCPWLKPNLVPIPRDGRWHGGENRDCRPGYTRVRLYRARHLGGEPKISCLRSRGKHPQLIGELEAKLSKIPQYTDSQGSLRSDRAVWIPDPSAYLNFQEVNELLGCSETPIEFLLFDSKIEWIGWLAVDAQIDSAPVRKLGQEDARFLLPYAEEIAKIMEGKLDRQDLKGSETTSILERVQSRILLERTPENALQTVVDGIVNNLGIMMGHIELLKFSYFNLVAGRGLFFERAEKNFRADHPQSISRRVANTGLGFIANHRPNPLFEASVSSLPENLKGIMSEIHSVGVFPLKSFGKVEAVLTLYSNQENTFSGETLLLCSRLAEIASYALHDFSLRTETELKTAKIWREAAASFAHRIGNSLPAAKYWLRKTLGDSQASEQAKENARLAFDAVDRAMEITNLFRQHGSKMPIITDWKNAPLLMQEIVTKCNTLLDSGQIELRFRDWPSENVQVKADSGALKDMFVNLVADSVSFHQNHEPAITIECSLRNHQDSDGQLIFDYKDNGPGIPWTWKERIFEPFEKTRDEGTGIGLTDARRVVQGHEGTIREIGIFGKGVHFEIIIPLKGPERYSNHDKRRTQ